MNNDIMMGPMLIKGMQYKQFFGLYGSMPMAFTERVLYNSKEEDVFEFFDESFADLITKKEQEYYRIVHSYIGFFKRLARSAPKKYKMVKINNKFNTIGLSKIGKFMIGSKSFIYVNQDERKNQKIGKLTLK